MPHLPHHLGTLAGIPRSPRTQALGVARFAPGGVMGAAPPRPLQLGMKAGLCDSQAADTLSGPRALVLTGSGLSPPHSLLSARHVPCKQSLCGIRTEGSSCGTGRGREAGWGVGGGAEGPAWGVRDSQEASLSLPTRALSPPGCEVSSTPSALWLLPGRAPRVGFLFSWGTGAQRGEAASPESHSTLQARASLCSPPSSPKRQSRKGG